MVGTQPKLSINLSIGLSIGPLFQQHFLFSVFLILDILMDELVVSCFAFNFYFPND